MPPGYSQAFGIGKGGVLLAMGYYRGFRECYVPKLVTPEEVDLNVGSYGTGAASQLTCIVSLNFTGSWIILRGLLGVKTQIIHLGINN